MAQALVGQIAQAAGLPASVRVGTVVQTDPLVVSVQGATYAAQAVGVVEPGIPAAGEPIALLGQAGLSGGDPATWLALGSVRPSTAPVVVEPTLLNSWVNFAGGFDVAAYWRDSSGVVHLEGLIAAGATALGTTLFVLPAGYRPPLRNVNATISNGVLARVDVLPDGSVVTDSGVSAAWLSLAGITFRAAQ
jgi:hypothetical protein